MPDPVIVDQSLDPEGRSATDDQHVKSRGQLRHSIQYAIAGTDITAGNSCTYAAKISAYVSRFEVLWASRRMNDGRSSDLMNSMSSSLLCGRSWRDQGGVGVSSEWKENAGQ